MTIQERKQRHRRFWEPLQKGEGPCICVTSPLSDEKTLSWPVPKDVEEQWLSAEYALSCALADRENTYRGMASLQCEFINFGPGVLAALLGAPHRLTPHSIWFDLEPPLTELPPVTPLSLDLDHPLHRAIEDKTRLLLANAKDRFTVSYTDLGGNLDILFSLRGEELLTDLIDCPEGVTQASAQIDDAFLAYFNHQTELFQSAGQDGFTNWMPLWSDKPWYPLQCDFSVMISPAQFEEFVLPSLDRVSREIGRSVYHLDGPGELRHVDMLLSLPHVHAIQWVPLPTKQGRYGTLVQDFADRDSLALYEKCLKAEKKLMLLGIPDDQVQRVFDAVGSDGFFLDVNCMTRADAAAFEEAFQKEMNP